MSKPGKSPDLKAKRSTSKAKVEELPHGKKDDSKGKKDKDESKSKKDDTKGKSDTKLKESKSKEKGSKDPSSTNIHSEPASPVKTKSKSQTSPAGDESPTLPPAAQENLYSEEFLSPSTSDKNIRLETEPTSEEITDPEPAKEPPIKKSPAAEPKPKKKKKSSEGDDVEKKSSKEKESSSRSKKRQEDKDASQQDSDSSPKKSRDHTPDETESKRARSRSGSRHDQEVKQEKTDKQQQQEAAKEKCESSEREAKRKRSWASPEQSESRKYKACELPDRDNRKERPCRPQDSRYKHQESRYRPHESSYRPQESHYRPQESSYRSHESRYRPQESHYRPQESSYRSHESHYRPQESHHRPHESHYRPQESNYRQDKKWETRARDYKRDEWRSTDRESLKERTCHQVKESDYKKNKPWGSLEHDDQICEHKESSYRRKSWRPSTSSQEKNWDEPKSEYKNDTSWKFQDDPRKDEQRTHNSAPTCSTSYNIMNTESCRKTSYSTPACQRGQFWTRGSNYREDKRETSTCRCSADQPKYPSKSRCMPASGQQLTRCCQLARETMPKAQPTRMCPHQPEVKHCCMRGGTNATPQKMCSRTQDRQTHTCQERRKPVCCHVDQSRKGQCPRSPPDNSQPPQCLRAAPKRTCCSQPSAGGCLPRRLCCSVSRPTSCPTKDNDYCSNSGQSNTYRQTYGCSYDRCSTNDPDNMGYSHISSPSFSWNRMQSCAHRDMNCESPVQRSSFPNRQSCGFLTQHHSCMDFGTQMSGMYGCARSHSQHLMSLSRKEELLPNSLLSRSNSYLNSQQMYEPRKSFSEARAMKNFPAYTPDFRRRMLSELSGTKLSPTASYLARAATSQSFDSNHHRRNFRSSSFNRDTRESAYEAGATNRSLTEKDCSSGFDSVSDFKSVSLHSLSSGLDLQKRSRSFSRD